MPDIRTLGAPITEALQAYDDELQLVQLTAAEDISALRVVRQSTPGTILLARWPEQESRSPLGIATTGAASGNTVMVRPFGEMSDASWAWTAGEPVLLGVGGALYQGDPLSPFIVVIGMATGATSLFVNIQPPVTRA